MPSLKDIRDRIGSVKNTKKITSAMKLVAAAKLRRAQEAVEAARPYARKMHEMIETLAAGATSGDDEDRHPLLRSPGREERIAIILLTSNRGLCGGFNANLLRPFERFMATKRAVTSSIEVHAVGRKGIQFCKKKGFNMVATHTEIVGDITFEGAKEIVREPMEKFKRGELDKVYLVYNEFVSAIQTNQIFSTLLPLNQDQEGDAVEHDEHEEGLVEMGGDEYIFEPDEETLLARLLPNNVEIQIFQALLESNAAEQGSRMTAMDNATSNAEDMIDSLTLQYNRARQAYITKELVEIVSGAESLKG